MIKTTTFKKLILNTFQSNSITSNLEIDQTSLDYFLHLIQDSDISKDEKIETIRGILELQLDSTSISLSNEPHHLSLDECVENVLQVSSNYLQDPTQFEEEEEEEKETPTPLDQPYSSSINSDELQKKAIIATYGKVEDETNSNQMIKLTSKQIQDLKDKETSMLEQELKLLGLKSKSRKKVERKMSGDPLLRPNLNSAVVDYETKLKREEAASKSKAKSEKDKADLTKQRETQLKKKVDARARASKVERKA